MIFKGVKRIMRRVCCGSVEGSLTRGEGAKGLELEGCPLCRPQRAGQGRADEST